MTVTMGMCTAYTLSLLFGSTASVLISQKVHYQDMDKAPDALLLIGRLYHSTELWHCLSSCSENEGCKAVVYEGTVCYLYKQAVGTRQLKSGQKAIGEITRKSIYGKLQKMNLVSVSQFANCTQSSVYQQQTCYNLIDGNIATMWSTCTNALYEWVMLTFLVRHEVHAVDVWSEEGLQGQCSVLVFTFSNGISVEKRRECVGDDFHPNFNHFELDGELTTYVKMTCTERCHPPGWYQFFELIIMVRK